MFTKTDMTWYNGKVHEDLCLWPVNGNIPSQYCAMDTGAQVYCNGLYTCESGTGSGWDSYSLTVSRGLGNGGHLKQSIKVADPFIIRRTDFIYIKPTAARTTF